MRNGRPNAKHTMVGTMKDGPWSWVVLGAALLSQTLLGGMCLSGGVFYVVFENALNSSTITTSWLCSLPITMWFCASSIGSILTNRFGFRMCSFIGGVIAALGVSISFFANSVGFLFVSFGILMGLGFGINYTGCMTAVNVYFDKYKTIASGIVSIGHNVGLMIYSKVIIYLVDEYGWRGSMLIQGAIVFNLCLFSVLMFPLDDVEVSTKTDDYSTGNDVENRQIQNGSSASLKPKTIIYEIKKEFMLNGNLGSLNSLRFKSSNSASHKEQFMPLTQSENDQANRDDTSLKSSDGLLSKLGLFGRSDFCCFCASNILCNLSQGIYILHLPPYATDTVFTREDFGFVLTIYGASNIVGKVFYSFLGQHPKVNVTSLYAISLTATGISMALTPVFLTRSGMLTLAGLVGFFYCVTGALILAVVFRIVGYEQFANGLGLSLPFKATGNLIGGPLGGTLYSITGDYRTSFYLAGTSMIISSLLMIVPVIKHRHGDTSTDPEGRTQKFSICEDEFEDEEK